MKVQVGWFGNVLSSLFQPAGTDWTVVVFASSRVLSGDFSQPVPALSAMPTASASQNRRMDIGSDLMMKASKRIVCQARARLQDWTRRDAHKFGWHPIFYKPRSLMCLGPPVPFLALHITGFSKPPVEKRN
jgi:hypothetical protein